MKHPSDMILQRFVDEELNQVQKNAVTEHFLNCELCSDVVNQMNTVDAHVLKEETKMPLARKNILFDDAFKLLEKNKKIYSYKEKPKLNLYKYFNELKIPAISLGTCFAIVLILAQNEKNNLSNNDYISMDVEVYEGEKNEVDTSSITK